MDLKDKVNTVYSIGNSTLITCCMLVCFFLPARASISRPSHCCLNAIGILDTPKIDTNKVFTSAEKYPEFPGGLSALNKFISKNIRYPAAAYENDVHGLVLVNFVVERDGSLSDIKVIHGIGDGCDDEVLRVIKMSPKWTPALQHEQPIRISYSVPISFTISGNMGSAALDRMAYNMYSTSEDIKKAKSIKSSFNLASFPGGPVAFTSFLNKKIKYPAEALAAGIQGKITVSLIVDRDGSLSNINIIQGIGGGCDEEVIRAISASPKWDPATENGHAVKTYIKIPVFLTLSRDVLPGKDNSGVVCFVNTLEGTLANEEVQALDVLPEFPGGKEAFRKFLSKNILYPAMARENGVQGVVIASFLVGKDGAISHVNIESRIGDGCDEEVERIIKTSPQWKPGMVKNRFVETRYEIPVMFSLEGNSGWMVSAGVGNVSLPADIVDEYPQFPGGLDAFSRFLARSIRYPASARDNGVQGEVVVDFTIDSVGSLSDFRVLRSPSDAMADETIRVFKTSPQWTPAKLNGQGIKTAYAVPVNFTLDIELSRGNVHPIHVIPPAQAAGRHRS